MATTKIWAITSRLDNAIHYVENEDKTIDKAINYVSRNSATSNKRYVTCINCDYKDPYSSMKDLKEIYHDDHKRIAYHAIQSFEPGVGNPDLIHEIGVKLAEELFGNQYQVIVTTHLDKAHLHNHFIINSTSMIDGKHYCNTKSDYKAFKETSDRICKEYGLSIIDSPKGKGLSRKQYNLMKSYIREIKKDIDDLIPNAYTFSRFKEEMLLEGYEFITNNNNEDCIIHPNLDEPIPLTMLGNKYSLDSIYDRIADSEPTYSFKVYYKKLDPNDLLYRFKHHELSGLQYLYVKWQIDLGILQQRPRIKKQYLSKEIKRELRKLDLITHSTELLVSSNITTIDQLQDKLNEYNDHLNDLLYKRKGAYYQRKLHPDNDYWDHLIHDYSLEIKGLREDIKALRDVEKRSERLERQQQLMDEQDKKKGITR